MGLGFHSMLGAIGVFEHLASIAVAAATDLAMVDRKNYDGILFNINVGDLGACDGSNYFAIVLEEGELANGTDKAVVDDLSDVVFAIDGVVTTPETIASGIMKKLDATTDENKVYSVEYHGKMRYARITLTETGTVVTAPFSFTAILFNPKWAGATGVLPTA